MTRPDTSREDSSPVELTRTGGWLSQGRELVLTCCSQVSHGPGPSLPCQKCVAGKFCIEETNVFVEKTLMIKGTFHFLLYFHKRIQFPESAGMDSFSS